MEASEITVNVKANTAILKKQIKVITEGLEAIYSGLDSIDKGCPNCGNRKVKMGTLTLDKDSNKYGGDCSECGTYWIGVAERKQHDTKS